MKNKISLGITMMFSFVLGGLCMYYFSITHRVIVKENSDGTTTPVATTVSCKSCNSTVIMENGSLAAAVEKSYDGAVMIRNYSNNKVSSTGSGFIYKVDDKYAYIMTNHHVVSGGNKWTVITSTDEEIEGKVLGSDEYLDLAVVRVEKRSYMDAMVIGDSDKIKLGDTIFTIGAPVGYEYRGTVTKGIVSGLNRLVEVSVKNAYSGDWVMEVIQIDAAVNPGNSGGPLLNSNGEVIGVISMKLVENSIEGMGFAIPIDYAMSHVETLEKGGKIARPLLGISMANVSESYSLWRNGITIPEDVTEGVVVVTIAEKSGASKSGLQKGDVILELNGSKVKNSAYLKYLLFKYNPGDTVKITYNRNGKISTTNITLTKNEEE